MKSFKKTVSLLLAVMMLAGMFVTLKQETEARAASNVATPTFTLKRVNNGTGVKITINKTKGAEGYIIYMTKRDNAYSSYLYKGGDYEHEMAVLKKNGKVKRSYTIKGLPKGTYSFMVQAYAEEKEYDSASGNEYIIDTEYSDYSIEQSINIKAAKKKPIAEKIYDFSNVKVGDIIKFGSYEQDDDMTNGKEEIEWIVLAKDSKKILVVSKYALDCLPYNKEYREYDITWEKSSLREWLNKIFYKTAFTKKERTMINKVKLINDDNPYYGTEGGNDTKDKVFLLSLNDVINTLYGFDSDIHEYDITRRCAATSYAKAQGVWSYEKFHNENIWKKSTAVDEEPTCQWLLRSPGSREGRIAYVDTEGDVGYDGIDGIDSYVSVRPAMYINIKS
ncbi:MAG: hypothetical protein IKP88_07905 [Lachnospiraceae bacterium]|nr:hypothetical protein [Lachnospiraceae bacterium]